MIVFYVCRCLFKPMLGLLDLFWPSFSLSLSFNFLPTHTRTSLFFPTFFLCGNKVPGSSALAQVVFCCCCSCCCCFAAAVVINRSKALLFLYCCICRLLLFLSPPPLLSDPARKQGQQHSRAPGLYFRLKSLEQLKTNGVDLKKKKP